MRNSFRLLVLALIAVPVGLALAEPAAPTMPMVLPHGQKDVTLAPAGTYTLDPNHVAVLAGVSHLGFSVSMFRFGKAQATLDWHPDAIAKSSLTATVEMSSIATNVVGFAEQLQGADYLNVAKYPLASFVSTAFRQSDATHGKVDGQLTLLGRTLPVTFDVTLIGAGLGFAGGPVMGHVIGIHAETTLDAVQAGLPAVLAGPLKIDIDTEFDKKG